MNVINFGSIGENKKMFRTLHLMYTSIQVIHVKILANSSSGVTGRHVPTEKRLRVTGMAGQRSAGNEMKKQSHLLHCAAERLPHRLCYTLTTSDNKVITSLWTDGFSQRCRIWKCQRMTAKRKSFHALSSTLTTYSDTHRDPWLLSCSLGVLLWDQ